MTKQLSVALIGLVAICVGWTTAQEPVKTTHGPIVGTTSNGVRVFKGIPYAAPPVGDLRWKPPQDIAPWTDVRQASEYGKQCVQTPYALGSMYYTAPAPTSEDCLYLNVWTAAKTGERRPVMFWIHGGALTRGSGANPTYDGAQLARKGAVVVTINYRLGPLGYFAHPELTAESGQKTSGNYGVLDQIAALEWVQKNIAAFGGDASRVTIFGESAGSWAVNVLVASPLAKGLFHRAIGQSGGRFTGTPSLADAERGGAAFAKALAADSLAALRAVPAEKLLTVQGFRTSENVDGWVLPDTVAALFRAKKHNNVPVIVGSNADEMTTLSAASSWPETLDDLRKRASTYGELANEFPVAYPAATDADAARAWLASQRDATFSWHMRAWARATSEGGARAYLYYFSHVPPSPNASEIGAYHAAEIPYVFGNLLRNWPYADADRRLAEAMSSYWVNFATTGDPNGQGLPRWTPYDRASEAYLQLKNPPEPGNHLLRAQLDFHDRVQSRRSTTSAAR